MIISEPEHLKFSALEREGWRAFWAGYGLNVSAAGEAWARGWWLAYARAFGQGVKASALDAARDTEGLNPHPRFNPAGEAWAAGYDERADL